MATPTNVWRFTNAGRAAIMDGANRGVADVQFRTMAIGSGFGPGGAADDARTALRAQVATAATSGTTAVQGRIALQATFAPAAVVAVTEVGVMARVGDAGAEFLAAYWTDGGRVIARGGNGSTIVLAGSIDLQAAAADVDVTLQPALTITPPAGAPVAAVVSTAAAAAPAGWLLCDGAAVSRADYSALFAAIGTDWGAGDGATTFNVPDLRGRVVVGVGAAVGLTARGRGERGGAETHTLTEAELAAHNHTASTSAAGSHRHPAAGSHSHGYQRPRWVSGGALDAIYAGYGGLTPASTSAAGSHQHPAAGSHRHAVAVNDSGGGGAHNNMQPWVGLHCIIKT